MQTTEKAERRPFHETIVDAINRAASSAELAVLAPLIKGTKIPKGHDEIIAAWNDRLNLLGGTRRHDYNVPADLLEQKQEAAEKEKAKEKEQTEITSS